MALDEDRRSRAVEVELITDPDEKARQEARNGLRQFDEAIEQIAYWLQPERPYKLRISSILSLHRKALESISHFAGVFRPSRLKLGQQALTTETPSRPGICRTGLRLCKRQLAEGITYSFVCLRFVGG